MTLFIIAVVVACLCQQAPPPSQPAAAHTSEHDRLTASALKAWMDYRDVLRHNVAGMTRRVMIVTNSGRVVFEQTLRMRERGSCWLICSYCHDQLSQGRMWLDHVIAVNSLYACELMRKDEQNSYVMTHLHVSDGQAEPAFLAPVIKERRLRLSGVKPAIGEEAALLVSRFGGFQETWRDVFSGKTIIGLKPTPAMPVHDSITCELVFRDLAQRQVSVKAAFNSAMFYLPITCEYRAPMRERFPEVMVRGTNTCGFLKPGANPISPSPPSVCRNPSVSNGTGPSLGGFTSSAGRLGWWF